MFEKYYLVVGFRTSLFGQDSKDGLCALGTIYHSFQTSRNHRTRFQLQSLHSAIVMRREGEPENMSMAFQLDPGEVHSLNRHTSVGPPGLSQGGRPVSDLPT
jgi:hypothetical protein